MDIVRRKKEDPDKSRDSFILRNRESLKVKNAHSFGFSQSFDIDEEKKTKIREEVFKKDDLDDFRDFIKNSESKPVDSFRRGVPRRKTQNNFFNKKRIIKVISLFFFVLIGGGFFVGVMYVKDSLDTKKRVLGISKEAYGNINSAIDEAKNKNFSSSSVKFKDAFEDFSNMSKSLEGLGKGVISVSRFVPGASKLSSGYYLTEAGKQLSLAGEKISSVAGRVDEIGNRAKAGENQMNVSILEIFKSFEGDLNQINSYLLSAQENLEKVKVDDLPKENRDEIIELKTKLPVIINTVNEFSANSHIMADFLGANGPRKYLFLFQNNQEMRATGGFIGSYGVLDIDGTGKIRNFFIDGIFNPDGQLFDKIVPPKPIQKISVAWSLHDSNWFPDFPTSAKKAILFYEKTGGPTVDGVMTLTPTVIQKFLEITGPIEMPEYGVTLNKDNFIENIQYEVEVDYDKKENRPKKILSDLAPIILDKLSQTRDPKAVLQTTDVLNDALKEKHILLYFYNEELQKMVSELGWSGEMLNSSDDYLSVINSNINGYKTDGVVEEKISHEVNISESGEIIDTVTIKRRHNGGGKNYEWWNKVNANYMRVYVPKGSELLEVEGQTREVNEDVVDYDSLSFERDEDIVREESGMKIDTETGTRVYVEGDKTVFANWAYVSPQEEVIVKYKYKLPYKFSGDIRSYSLLIQKQSGSIGSGLDMKIKYPNKWKLEWKNEGVESCQSDDRNFSQICLNSDLKTDKFIGSVFLDK